jgi:hypothetical protein
MKYLLTGEDGTEYSEMLALKLQTPVNHKEDSLQLHKWLQSGKNIGHST